MRRRELKAGVGGTLDLGVIVEPEQVLMMLDPCDCLRLRVEHDDRQVAVGTESESSLYQMLRVGIL